MEFAVAMFLIRQKVDEEKVSAEESAIANKIYDMLDVWDNGYIDTETAIAFFMRSRLPGYELEEIWCEFYYHEICYPDLILVLGVGT